MKDFIGNMEVDTIMEAIENAKKIKPDCKRFYGRVDGNRLILVIRKRMKNVIEEIPVAEQVIEDSEQIVDFDPEVGELVNGYPVCISIPKYLSHCELFGQQSIRMQYKGNSGYGVGCSL